MTTPKRTILTELPFTRHAAFTLWRLEPGSKKNGVSAKPFKVPVHYDGHTRHSLGRPARGTLPAVPRNPAPPLSAEQARQWLDHHMATSPGAFHNRPGEVGYLGIGFRPDGTGLACLDIDNCLVGGQWSATALEMMARFPGALVELSTGGSGLHIWFSYTGESPGKLTKDSRGELELYGEGQFIAAGTVLQGDAGADCTAAMRVLMAERWPARLSPAERGGRAFSEWNEKSDTEKAEAVGHLRSALRHLAGDNTYRYPEWVETGMPLATMGEDGNALWHEFSSWHPDYDFDNAEYRWERLNPGHTGYASLFRKAEAAGWQNPNSKVARLAAATARAGEAFGALALPAAVGAGGFGQVAAPRPVERPNLVASLAGRAQAATDVVARPVAAESQQNPGTRGMDAAPDAINSIASFGAGAADGWQPPAGTPPPPASGPYVAPDSQVGDHEASLLSAAADSRATLPNVLDAITGAEMPVKLGWDEFYGAQMIAPDGQVWRPLNNEDPGVLRVSLERGGFKPVPPEIIKTAIGIACAKNKFDSAKEWASGLVWDGVPRVATAMSRYFGCEDTPYSRAVADYLFSALAGRAMDPGCQADMVPVLVGRQGARKTSAVRALAPIPQSFVAIDLSKRDDDLSRRLRGKLVAEWPELRGLRGREVTAVRAWITTKWESWIEKYETKERTFGRRFIAIGTANEDELLDDNEGERRWLPLTVCHDIQVEAIERDCQQLWAEGVAMWRQAGVHWRQAEELAKGEHWKYKVLDEWTPVVKEWLEGVAVAAGQPIVGGEKITGLPRGETPFEVRDVAIRCLGINYERLDKKVRNRIGGILSSLGYTSRVVWDGKDVRRWVKTT